MKTKKECLDLLDEAEKRIKAHQWDKQVDDPDELVSHKQMLLHVLEDFSIPIPQEVGDDWLLLPLDWLPDENPQNSTAYDDVTERFIEVYDLLRFEYSRENEAYLLEADQDEKDMHADFYRIVGWRK
jgi:hypothetical protein